MAEIKTTYHEEEPIATVTISNPERRNAVGEPDMEEFADTFRALDGDDDVRCVILTGEGDAFCAGADLAASLEMPTAETIDRGFHDGVRSIMLCSKPVIAKVQGPAVGAGASLAVACDFVYAGESARIGFAFSRIGLTADSGATFILPRLVGRLQAMELLATAEIVDADRAEDLGLVTTVVPDDALEECVEERATDIANGPTRVLASLKRLLLRSNDSSLEAQLDLESRDQERMFNTDDVMEGMSAFMEGRDPEFSGS